MMYDDDVTALEARLQIGLQLKVNVILQSAAEKAAMTYYKTLSTLIT